MSSFKDREKGNDRRLQAYEYLVTNGLKPHLAAGVVGNLMQESFGHLDPTAVGDGGKSIGIAQWNGQRLTNLKRYAKNNKSSYTDFETQLGFLNHEINTTYDQGSSSWNKKQQSNFFKANNAESAAEAFMVNFERPSAGEVHNRKKYAAKLYLETNDSNIYSQNSKGEIVSVDPTTASPEVIKNSPNLQRQLYNTEFSKLSSEFKTAAEANRLAEAKIKAYNESEELQRAKEEIKSKYNEERFMESLTYGNNNSIQTGGPINNTEAEPSSEEAAQTTTATETTGKNDLLAQAFKAPEKTPVQQEVEQQQGPDMYPGLETSENEYYAAYLPEGFADGGEADPPTDPPTKQVKRPMSLADLEIDKHGDYRFIQPLEEVTIVGKSKATADKEAVMNSDYDRLSGRLNSSGIDIKDAEIAATQKLQETTAVNRPTKAQVHREDIPVSSIPQTTKLEKGSKGQDVVKLQELLIEQGFLNDEFGADGKFGKNTKAAVIAYQRSKNLKEDGIVGKNTLGAMKGLTPKMTELPTSEFLTNRPKVTPIEVEQSKNSTKVIRGALGMIAPDQVAQFAAATATGDNVVSFEDMSGDIKQEVMTSVLNAIKRTGKVTGGTEYIDYSQEVHNAFQGLGAGAKEMLSLNPKTQAAVIAGRVSFVTNDDGSISVYDSYDFSPTDKDKADTLYKKVRHFAGKQLPDKGNKGKLVGTFRPEDLKNSI